MCEKSRKLQGWMGTGRVESRVKKSEQAVVDTNTQLNPDRKILASHRLGSQKE